MHAQYEIIILDKHSQQLATTAKQVANSLISNITTNISSQ